MVKNTDSHGDTHLTTEEQHELGKLIADRTAVVVAKEFKIAPHTLRSAAGGLACLRGSVLMVRAGLAEARKRKPRKD